MSTRRARLAPWLGVGVAAACTAILYSVLGRGVEAPIAFGDELRYFDASLAFWRGDGLSIRGGSYGYGPLYPMFVAPVFGVAADVPAAYDLAKIINAALFASASFPVFLLARRVVGAAPAVIVAALSVAIPSSVYVANILTESLAYPVVCVAFLAIARVGEHPSGANQLLALGATTAAVLVRPQMIGLIVVLWAVLLFTVACRAPFSVSEAARSVLPTAAITSLAALALVAVGLPSLFSGYSAVGGSYQPADVVAWSIASFAIVGISLGFVPVLLGPTCLRCLRDGARSSSPDRSFLVLLVSASLVLIAEAGAFSSRTFGDDRIHERYLFYLEPLWIIFSFLWIVRFPRPRRWELAAGATLAAAVCVGFPTRLVGHSHTGLFEAPSTALLGLVDTFHAGAADVRVGLVSTVLVVALAIICVSRRRGFTALLLGLVLALNSTLAWGALSAPDVAARLFAHTPRDWVDRSVPSSADVTSLFVGSRACMRGDVRLAFLWSEFFSGAPRRALHLVRPSAPVIASDAARLEKGGLVSAGGQPQSASFVLTVSGVHLRGRLVAVATPFAFAIWEVDGPIRTLGDTNSIVARACA